MDTSKMPIERLPVAQHMLVATSTASLQCPLEDLDLLRSQETETQEKTSENQEPFGISTTMVKFHPHHNEIPT
ncbi:hypothetical protein AAES_134020 [Amazona aestiva]|uniref:Uncharacterized protein n=1 Tax=Amazona aestiva TaxID=12930 RepID=A0A0Q3UQS7_AMAAE|nr:hypothetical protein AAES_134020 [Amazona aestiva]